MGLPRAASLACLYSTHFFFHVGTRGSFCGKPMMRTKRTSYGGNVVASPPVLQNDLESSKVFHRPALASQTYSAFIPLLPYLRGLFSMGPVHL